MERVSGEFTNRLGETIRFTLDSDQGFNYTTWKPPTNWMGYVGGHSIKFVQINASGSERDDYDWSNFPEELKLAIPSIIEAIDDAMRIMD